LETQRIAEECTGSIDRKGKYPLLSRAKNKWIQSSFYPAKFPSLLISGGQEIKYEQEECTVSMIFEGF